MPPTNHTPDWHSLAGEAAGRLPTQSPTRRLRVLALLLTLPLAVVGGRVVSLELRYGEAFRAEASRPLQRQLALAAPRGRILAADGTVLACDEPLQALAIRYRWLQQPADPRWLRAQARARTSRSQWRDRKQMADAEQQVLADRAALHARLAALCHRSPEQFAAAAARIQARVETIAERVNARRRQTEQADDLLPRNDAGWWTRLVGDVKEALFAPPEEAPALIVVSEELTDHVIHAGLDLAAVAEIQGKPADYPGVSVVERTVRRYPQGSLASHALGHLGATVPDEAAEGGPELIGRMGVEAACEHWLRGRAGEVVERIDRSGQQLTSTLRRERVPGRDVILSLDVGLQRKAEELLDAALAERSDTSATGGAVVVMELRSGRLLASASAPRFDPNRLGESAELVRLAADASGPLFDRPTKMAIPPGSVFKPLTAVALLESGTVEPTQTYFCQGFFERPDRERCLIYRRYGEGHDTIDLADALARSCNSYFFHFATDSGPAPLMDWAARFGFGQRTGIDLPDEARGSVPTQLASSADHPWTPADTRALAIGQSGLTVTPLQIMRMMGALATDGQLLTPRITRGLGLAAEGDTGPPDDLPPAAAPQQIEGLHHATLEAVRLGLEHAVTDPHGTAHRTASLAGLTIAGKTGTAETGGGQADHAWFAGYAPAEQPRVAFVVVLEHGGGGSDAAAPIARKLLAELKRRGGLD